MRAVKVSPIRLTLAAVQNADKVQHDIAPCHQPIKRGIIVNIGLHDRHRRVYQKFATMLQPASRYVHNVPLRH
jgi:hypothetical protein